MNKMSNANGGSSNPILNGRPSISYQRFFSEEGKDPFSSFEWEKRDVEIKKSSGKIIYQNFGIEVPKIWSTTANKVVSSKYFFKGDGKDYTEKSVKQLVGRVADSIASYAVRQGILNEVDSQAFRDDLVYLETSQSHSFNSPVWFNVGLHDKYGVREKVEQSSHWAIDSNGKITNDIDAYDRPQAAACFIQSIGDDMQSILYHAEKEGMLFKFGSGTGTNFSNLRGINEPLSGGGVASGALSFLRIYDIIAGRIQSGGKTRRAAKMVILDDNHPDLFRFINWKVNEEKKALWLSANPLWGPTDAGDLESEAYKTVDGQNGNNSVRVSDAFMEAALTGSDWNLDFRTANRFSNEVELALDKYRDDRYLPDKRFIKKLTNKRKVVNAGDALEQIARAATVTGDPALQYDSTINKWHTCKNSGRINASNPCSEFMFIDNSACNLASINLTKFRRNGSGILDLQSYKQAIKSSIISQEVLVDQASYPSKDIAENSHKFRPLGLGYTNLGALLMENGVAYDSDEGRAIASAVTSLMTAYAYQTSAELASKLGPFEEFEKNREPMLEVIKMHSDASKKIKKIDGVKGLETVLDEAQRVWEDVIKKGEQYGFRNSQVTLLAPTGTIGFMMDVDCTGVEPMIALKSSKGLAGGGELKRDLAPCVTRGLETLGYSGNRLEKIIEYISKNSSVVGAPELNEEDYNVFQTAFGNDNTVSVDGHLNMMAAVQPFLSGAISKTVNLPKGSSIDEVKKTYVKGWKLGLKSISLYIDGAKGIQPVNIEEVVNGPSLKWGQRVKPEGSLGLTGPIERIGWNVSVNSTGVHIMIGEYQNRPPKDSPADFFVEFGGAGSEYSAAYITWGKEASRNRQRGAPLEEFIKHNRGARGALNGFTNHPFIKSCSSIEDLTAKLIQLEYLGDTSVCDVQPSPEQMENLRCNVLGRRRREQHFDSRIKFIESVMEKGKVQPIFPLFQDEVENGKIPVGQEFCINCGSKTVLSGANCRKCPNCGNAGGCG
ncbi:MAG: vitamin B12-dependent ribonucleotide reductase [Candidatus Pacearchaeota archaeon]|jgi:ribonucleoside-diphosphate reductase alpha chain